MPEPVGAQISVLAPVEIVGQPSAWAGVGASNEISNQRLVAGEKPSNGSDFTLRFAAMPNPSMLRMTRCFGAGADADRSTVPRDAG